MVNRECNTVMSAISAAIGFLAQPRLALKNLNVTWTHGAGVLIRVELLEECNRIEHVVEVSGLSLSAAMQQVLARVGEIAKQVAATEVMQAGLPRPFLEIEHTNAGEEE